MRIFFSFIYLSTILISGCGVKAVLYGEHRPNTETGYYAIHLDQYGDYYPELEIPNSKIKSNGSNLDALYKNEKGIFTQQLFNLGLDTSKSISFEEFQKKVVEFHGLQIDKRIKEIGASSVTFILVGYNNKYEDASKKLESLRSKINYLLNQSAKKTLVVELYWDGKAMLFGIDAVSIFDNAQANSYNTGIQLRLLMNQIRSTKQIYFISHSLGANVVTQCLFNQMKKVQDDSHLGNNSVKLSLQKKYNSSEYVLDNSKQYSAAIVAPAIPGVYTFIDYGKRGYSFDKNSDNYKIYGGINIHDRVLNKFIGKASLFGSTSFGCKYSEVSETFKLFANDYNSRQIDTVDFSGRKSKQHGLEFYMKHNDYERLLKKLYGI